MPSHSDEIRRIFYGRRRGRKLHAAKRQLMAATLPRFAIGLDAGLKHPHNLFDPPPARLWLEIGFGTGEHLAAQAQAHRDIGMIGCEPFLNGVAALVETIERNALHNIRIYPDDVRDLLDALPDASIERCFILFPDPWPKRRHHRRRFIGAANLDALARVLCDGAELRLASDHRGYVRWTLFHTLAHGAFEWTARDPADWRQRTDDWPATRYEAKALARGDECCYLRFSRRSRSLVQKIDDGNTDALPPSTR